MIDIYCINLDERTDRWNFIQKQFSTILEINVIRISAIKHKHGWIGCGLSHISIIEKYMNTNKYLIVIEDDCVINNVTNFYDRLINIFVWLDNNMDKWEIFNGNPSYVKDINNCKILDKKLKIIKYGEGGTANFIIYNAKKNGFYERLLQYKKNIFECINLVNLEISTTKNKLKKKIYIKDTNGKISVYNVHKNRNRIIYDKFLNNNFICITSIPLLTSQLISDSNIEKRYIDYNNAIKMSEELFNNLYECSQG